MGRYGYSLFLVLGPRTESASVKLVQRSLLVICQQPNHTLRHPKYHPIETMGCSVEVHWGVPVLAESADVASRAQCAREGVKTSFGRLHLPFCQEVFQMIQKVSCRGCERTIWTMMPLTWGVDEPFNTVPCHQLVIKGLQLL